MAPRQRQARRSATVEARSRQSSADQRTAGSVVEAGPRPGHSSSVAPMSGAAGCGSRPRASTSRAWLVRCLPTRPGRWGVVPHCSLSLRARAVGGRWIGGGSVGGGCRHPGRSLTPVMDDDAPLHRQPRRMARRRPRRLPGRCAPRSGGRRMGRRPSRCSASQAREGDRRHGRTVGRAEQPLAVPRRSGRHRCRHARPAPACRPA